MEPPCSALLSSPVSCWLLLSPRGDKHPLQSLSPPSINTPVSHPWAVSAQFRSLCTNPNTVNINQLFLIFFPAFLAAQMLFRLPCAIAVQLPPAPQQGSDQATFANADRQEHPHPPGCGCRRSPEGWSSASLCKIHVSPSLLPLCSFLAQEGCQASWSVIQSVPTTDNNLVISCLSSSGALGKYQLVSAIQCY